MKKIIIILVILTSLSSYSQRINYFDYNNFIFKYVSKDGIVDYDKISKNKGDLKMVLAIFEKVKPTIYWTKIESLAFWINVYNINSIKLIIDNYPVMSIKEINNAWSNEFIPFNEKLVSLDYIDDKILRPIGDPRYHFAINCTSYSCPVFRFDAYDVDKIDSQLEDAAFNFINDAATSVIWANH